MPPSLDRARLTIQTASNTPTATSHPLITATSGNLSHTTTRHAGRSSRRRSRTSSWPPRRGADPCSQGDQTNYQVNVTRTAGFSGPVNLSVAGLPKGATASWNPSTPSRARAQARRCRSQTAGNTPTGSYDLTITGTGTVGGKTVSRSAAATLIVQKTQDFRIAGNLGTPLAPGRKAPLNLALTNPYSFDLQITNLAVALAGTNNPGCSGAQNFAVTQMPAARYPITLPAGQTRTLGQLGVADGDKPQVAMLNQPWNQDACKNAAITLDYSGSAGK